MQQDPASWVQMMDRYGVSLVMLAFVSFLFVAILWVGWKQFLMPMRERELKFVDDVSDGLKTERAATRESLQTISQGIQAIEGYAKALDHSQIELKTKLDVHHHSQIELKTKLDVHHESVSRKLSQLKDQRKDKPN